MLGPHWEDIEGLFHYLDIAIVAGIVVLAAYLIYHRQRIVSYIRS
jgi:hypothetical protein